MSFGFDSDTYMVLGGIPVARATRLPCPVCGHPTGDCTASEDDLTQVAGSGVTSERDGRILEHSYIVTEDIYEERQVTPYTTTKVLVAKAGSAIPMSKAVTLGLVEHT